MSRQTAPAAARTPLDSVLERIRATFAVEFEPLNVDERPLQALAINNMQTYLNGLVLSKAIQEPLRDLPLWAKIWPASFVLGRFLRKFEPQGKTLLEIGCGMGICSLIAARHGFSRIVATDMNQDALDFTLANVLANELENLVSVARLDITSPWPERLSPSSFDFIAASELLYLDDLHRPLLKFIGRHLSPGGRAFFCSDLARARPRFKKLAAAGFSMREGHIRVKSVDEEGQEQRRVYTILILERK